MHPSQHVSCPGSLHSWERKASVPAHVRPHHVCSSTSYAQALCVHSLVLAASAAVHKRACAAFHSHQLWLQQHGCSPGGMARKEKGEQDGPPDENAVSAARLPATKGAAAVWGEQTDSVSNRQQQQQQHWQLQALQQPQEQRQQQQLLRVVTPLQGEQQQQRRRQVGTPQQMEQQQAQPACTPLLPLEPQPCAGAPQSRWGVPLPAQPRQPDATWTITACTTPAACCASSYAKDAHPGGFAGRAAGQPRTALATHNHQPTSTTSSCVPSTRRTSLPTQQFPRHAYGLADSTVRGLLLAAVQARRRSRSCCDYASTRAGGAPPPRTETVRAVLQAACRVSVSEYCERSGTPPCGIGCLQGDQGRRAWPEPAGMHHAWRH